MRRVVSFIVPGKPQGKARARKSEAGHFYTPTKTVKYELEIGWAFKAEAKGWGEPITGPVKLHILAVMPIPKSTKNRTEKEAMYAPVKPDLDNVEKVVCDALNELAWKDDSQVVECGKAKYYETEVMPPGLYVKVEEV